MNIIVMISKFCFSKQPFFLQSFNPELIFYLNGKSFLGSFLSKNIIRKKCATSDFIQRDTIIPPF
jgi:hypothetical protein